MWKKILIVLIPVVAAGTIAGGATYRYSGTEFTDPLDEYNSATVDGKQALRGNYITGRVQGRYSRLGWLGIRSEPLECPDLEAEEGASVTCKGEKDSGLTVPVRVVKTGDKSITWKFER